MSIKKVFLAMPQFLLAFSASANNVRAINVTPSATDPTAQRIWATVNASAQQGTRGATRLADGTLIYRAGLSSESAMTFRRDTEGGTRVMCEDDIEAAGKFTAPVQPRTPTK